MTRRIMVAALVPLLVIALAGVSQAWQGQMEDPYGLLQDESDFLTHPSQIAQGEGIRFYGHYRFTYTDAMDWDYALDRLDAPLYFHFDTSGQEYSHNALLGAAYDGMRGDYDGDEDCSDTSTIGEYDLTKEFDKVGGEGQIAYRQEEYDNRQQSNLDGDGERDTSADNVLKLLKTDKARIEWSTGGGVSVLFDL